MNMPSWLLLLWCGLGGTCGAAVIGSVLGGSARMSWSLDPLPDSAMRGVAWSIVAGLVVYPAVYGVVFEAIRRSDYRIGLVLGAAHALIVILACNRRLGAAAAMRIVAIHVVYGTTLAFLYVTP